MLFNERLPAGGKMGRKIYLLNVFISLALLLASLKKGSPTTRRGR